MGVGSCQIKKRKKQLVSKVLLCVENKDQFSVESCHLNCKEKLVNNFVLKVILLYFTFFLNYSTIVSVVLLQCTHFK